MEHANCVQYIDLKNQLKNKIDCYHSVDNFCKQFFLNKIHEHNQPR